MSTINIENLRIYLSQEPNMRYDKRSVERKEKDIDEILDAIYNCKCDKEKNNRLKKHGISVEKYDKAKVYNAIVVEL